MYVFVIILQLLRVTRNLVKMAARVAWWQVLGLANALVATLAMRAKKVCIPFDIATLIYSSFDKAGIHLKRDVCSKCKSIRYPN